MEPNLAIHAILKALRKRTGLSIRDVAAHLEVPHSSYQHYESQRFKGPYLPLDLVHKLAGLFGRYGVDPADLYSLAGVDEANAALQRPAARGMQEEIVPFAKDDLPLGDRIMRALVPDAPGSVAAWHVRGRALDLAGYLPGDVAIVDLNCTPEAGDTVVAQRYNWQFMTATTLMRIFEPPYLIAASTDATFRKPDLVDNELVIIKGVIIASYRLRSGTTDRL